MGKMLRQKIIPPYTMPPIFIINDKAYGHTVVQPLESFELFENGFEKTGASIRPDSLSRKAPDFFSRFSNRPEILTANFRWHIGRYLLKSALYSALAPDVLHTKT